MSREFFPLPDSSIRMQTIVGDLQCIKAILASLHEMDARRFYGSRRATKVTTIAEAYDAVENNKNVVNIVVLLPIDGDSGSKESDCEDVISDIE